jgi:hypothetical protein
MSTLLEHATEFEVPWCGRIVTISRRTNHGRMIPDGNWCVGIWHNSRSSQITTVDYLSRDGKWRYKAGDPFSSPQAAMAALETAEVPA